MALTSVVPELKKLRLLGRKCDIPAQRVIAKTRKYLLAVGALISTLPDGGLGAPDYADLWAYVADFTENEVDGEKLRHSYEKLEAKRAMHGDAALDMPEDEAEGAPSGGGANGVRSAKLEDDVKGEFKEEFDAFSGAEDEEDDEDVDGDGVDDGDDYNPNDMD